MQPLTERQELIIQYIEHSIRDRGYPPTLREIGAHMGIRSTNGVSDHLRALERKGYLRRDDMKSRALRPVPRTAPGGVVLPMQRPVHSEPMRVPVLGRVAAGPLSLAAPDEASEHITFDPQLLRGQGEPYALRVKGDSMIDAGILDGDTVFVRRAATADRGEIIVARLGEEATLKRYYPERDHIRLQPENKSMPPILIGRRQAEAAGFEVLGVVVGLFRPLRPR